MKPALLAIWLVFLCSATASKSYKCNPERPLDIPKDTKCEISFHDVRLRPTQSRVGFQWAKYKLDLLKGVERRDSCKFPTIKDYLKENVIPVVIGPGGEFFLTDDHHLLKALDLFANETRNATQNAKANKAKSVRNDINIHLHVLYNWGKEGLTEKQFWQKMAEHHYVYLRDIHGEPLAPSQLPLSLSAMGDDPWRTVVGFARKLAYFETDSTHYYQFLWGLCLQKNGFLLDHLTEENVWNNALKAAQFFANPANRELFAECGIKPRMMSMAKIAEKTIDLE